MTSSQLTTCRVILDNQVVGSRQEITLPTTADEAMENCFPVTLAVRWHRWYGADHSEPLGVAIHQKAGEILIRWYAVDPEAARAAMASILAGNWGLELL